MTDILGFPCTITDSRVCAAIEHVLDRIRDRQTDDEFPRLRTKVKGFRWLSVEESRKGTVGWWKPVPITKAYRAHVERDARALLAREFPSGMHPDRIAMVVEDLLYDRCRRYGEVLLRRDLADEPEYKLLATIAHELGHAATRQDDFEKREAALDGDGEWASEACADYNGFKWGFESEIRRISETRRLGHHGGLPGDIIETEGPEGIVKYRVTSDFYYREVEAE